MGRRRTPEHNGEVTGEEKEGTNKARRQDNCYGDVVMKQAGRSCVSVWLGRRDIGGAEGGANGDIGSVQVHDPVEISNTLHKCLTCQMPSVPNVIALHLSPMTLDP